MSKRKNDLFQKGIQLSSMCQVDVFVCIFDRKKQKVYELTSSDDFDSQIVSHILDPVNRQQFKHETYTNEDLDQFKSYGTQGELIEDSDSANASENSNDQK